MKRTPASLSTLRTIRSAIQVPPADKMTQRHIAAFAKAAAHHNARVLLQNGLRISPDGSVDRPGELRAADADRSPGGGETTRSGQALRQG